MSVSKGAPLRALSIIAAFWILGRVAWEAASPVGSMDSAAKIIDKNEAAQTDAIPAQDADIARAFSALPPSSDQAMPLPVLSNPDHHQPYSRSFDSGSMASAWVQSEKGGNRVPSLPAPNEQPESSILTKRAFARPPQRGSEDHRLNIASQSSNRLSGYFWAFARQGDGSTRLGPMVPATQSPGGQYGGSQAGAILTYRLTGNQQENLSAFVRASVALSPVDDEELAIGLKVRAFPKIPISFFAEQRVGADSLYNRGTAFYAAGGTGPDRLIADIELETYGQAGYIFSDNDSYFFDASATLKRTMWEQGKFKITAGAGFWAGGQEGLTRLDIGPRASAHVPVGDMNMRFSLDWRQRIGGNAVPDSGVALTVTTGF